MVSATLLHGHPPTAIGLSVQANHLAVVVHLKAGLGLEVLQKQMSQSPVVDIRARYHPRRSNRFAVVAPVHDQGSPASDG